MAQSFSNELLFSFLESLYKNYETEVVNTSIAMLITCHQTKQVSGFWFVYVLTNFAIELAEKAIRNAKTIVRMTAM